jgi:hypothetical protein
MMYEHQDNLAVEVVTEGQRAAHAVEQLLTHQCFVCGDTIELTAQVCSRFCMRALEQMDLMDSLEAQVVPSPTNSNNTTSDYPEPSTTRMFPDYPSTPTLQSFDN